MNEERENKLKKGIEVNGFLIYAKRVRKGRFKEEKDFEIFIKNKEREKHLLYSKVFYGRGKFYKPWIELFGISKSIDSRKGSIYYFGSPIEEKLLSFFSETLDSSCSLYVEYYEDEETSKQLGSSFPSPVSRLGYRLFNLGFTWFKDWYIPEGFMEGGQKLQAQKPENDEYRANQLKTIYKEISLFLNKETDSKEKYYIRAVERAKNIINLILNPNVS